MYPHFLMELDGDLVKSTPANRKHRWSIPARFERSYTFPTLEKALEFVEKKMCSFYEDEEGPYLYGLNPKRDRIIIWEVSAPDQKKVVWHFSGWGWWCLPGETEATRDRLEQGKLPGHEKSLYEEMDGC